MTNWIYHGVILDDIGARIDIEILNPANGKSCRVHAQIDSGASSTSITKERLTSLGVNPVSGQKATAFISGQAIPVDVYQVALFILHPKVSAEAFAPILVTDTLRPMSQTTIEALLGQDVLNRFQFLYDGPNKKFTLTRS